MYAAWKQTLNALSGALASEVEPFRIRVVSIEPGFFGTEIHTYNISRDEVPSEVYEADQEWIRSFLEAGVEGGADAFVIADAIVSAAIDAETPLHRPVGDDAAMYLELQNQVDGFQGWRAAMMPIVESAVGPRPPAG